MLGEILCPKCHQKQWSSEDEHYLSLLGICWWCDNEKWKRGEMTLAEFEKREKKAKK